MCGIVGAVNFNGVKPDAAVFEKAVNSLSHRGPDSQTYMLRENVGLGHTRLAIVDPNGGHQPMPLPDGQSYLVYNGELYNTEALRQQLEWLGFRCKGKSDTEIVGLSWLAWQEKCVTKLRGMFAFAVVNFRSRTVFLARDHFGIKPLFYHFNCNQLIFASEISAIQTLKSTISSVPNSRIDEFLALGYVGGERTIYSDIWRLKPAHFLTSSLDSCQLSRASFWRLPLEEQPMIATEDIEDALYYALQKSVRRHIHSAPCFGAYLSGGVDSSLLVSLLREDDCPPIKAFTASFKDMRFDEAEYASYVSKELGLTHECISLEEEIVAGLSNVTARHGQPFADASSLPTIALAGYASKSLKVVLSGEGADETFLGYPSHVNWLSEVLKTSPNSKDPLYLSSLWRNCMVGKVANERVRNALWKNELNAEVDGHSSYFDDMFAQLHGAHPVSQVRAVEYQTYLSGWILAKQDHAAMAHGLEVRTPFLDVEICELVARIPPTEIMTDSVSGLVTTKPLLKSILKRFFPAEFVERRKQGFVPPMQSWLSTKTSTYGLIYQCLTSRNLHILEYFNSKSIRTLFDGPIQENWQTIYALYCLEIFLSTSETG